MFDYQGAKNEGYTDEEILNYLSGGNPSFDVKGAIKEGYTPEEISQYLAESNQGQKEGSAETPSLLNKAGRVAGQYGLGLVEAAALPYDIAVAPLNIPGGQETLGDVFTRDILNEVYPTEQEGRQPRATPFSQPQRELAEPLNIGTRDLIEKATGLDLKPEGALEKAANWVGFIRDPRKLFELGKTGLNKTDLIKAITPTGKEMLRGAGAGFALDQAEKGNYGPIGTMAAAVFGDISGNLAATGLKKIKNIISNPRQALADVAKAFTKKDEKQLQEEIIKSFRESGIQADIGTITGSDMVKWLQSRLAQSGLTGKALDDLRKTQTEQIINEYKKIAQSVGEAKLATTQEAGFTLKNAVKKIREADLEEARIIFKEARNEISESAHVNTQRLATAIEEVESSLKPGNLKASEQNAVLDVLERLKRDIYDTQGNLIYGNVKDLMNNKIALGEIIDYEVQGGSKQLLKNIQKELDRAIISYGKEKPSFARKYISANKRFSQHAKTFRNKNISQLLKSENAEQIFNRMNSLQGIQDIRKILNKTKEGQEVFKELSRFQLDRIISDNMVDSVTQNLKHGTFSKLLEKGKNRELIREIMPKESYKRLSNLQKNSGVLADTAQKFLNASKSGITIEDAGLVFKALNDLVHVFSGNIFPLVKTGLGFASARYLTKLMGDPTFLKLVEEAILAAESNNLPLMNQIAKELASPIKAALNQTLNQQE